MNLLSLTFPELEALVTGLGEPKFRAKQLWQWLWGKGCHDLSLMSDLSKAFRDALGRTCAIELPKLKEVLVGRDMTAKFLLQLADGELVESVLIPEKDHWTQCLSTQVGCALGCTFCSTGRTGLRRNMQAFEIGAQVLIARKYLQDNASRLNLRNLVLMGMGEPLLNWPEVKKALEIFNHPLGLDFSSRRVTLSTVGIPDRLLEFGASGLGRLAVSLHAPAQELRRMLMPRAANMLDVRELVALLGSYPLKPRERITFEYILIKGINDSDAQARDLVRLLNPLKYKVNLIALNPGEGIGYVRPEPRRIESFLNVLADKGVTAVLRKSKGEDVLAACGQLRAERIGKN